MPTFDLRLCGPRTWALLAGGVALLAGFLNCSAGDTCLRHSDCDDGLSCVAGTCTAFTDAEGGTGEAGVPPVEAGVLDASPTDAKVESSAQAGDGSRDGLAEGASDSSRDQQSEASEGGPTDGGGGRHRDVFIGP